MRAGRGALAVFLVAFAVRALYLVQARADPLHDFAYALADSLYYHRQALALLDGRWLGESAYFLGPLYAHFLALCYALFGPSLEAVRWVQALLGALSCVLLLRIAARCFGPRVGLVAGGLLAVYGLHVYYTGVLLPTVLVLLLNLLFLDLLLGALAAGSPARAAGAGAVLGLAVLAKSNALLLLPIGMGLAWQGGGVGVDRGRRGAWCAALAAATLLVIAPATLHNLAASGRFVLVTTSTGRNLWKGNGPHANGTHPLGHREGDVAGLGKRLWDEVEPGEAVAESGSYTSRTLRYAVAHPGRVARVLALKTALFFNAAELSVRDNYYFAQRYSGLLRLPLVGFAVLAPLGLAGMVSAWRLRPRPLALYAVFAAQVVSFVGVFVLARYRIVAAACLLVFAAHEVLRWWDLGRARRWRELAPGVAIALVAAACVNVPLPGFSRERGFALGYEKLGDMYALKGRPAEAVAAYRQALDADWQDLDPVVMRGETLLRIARVQQASGDDAAARATLDALLAEPPGGGARADRLTRDARALRAELGPER